MDNIFKREMERLGVTRAQLTKMTGLGYSTINDLYSGRSDVSRMTVGAFSRLADAFGMTMDELYSMAKDPSVVAEACDPDLVRAWRSCSDGGRSLMVKMSQMIAVELGKEDGDDA